MKPRIECPFRWVNKKAVNSKVELIYNIVASRIVPHCTWQLLLREYHQFVQQADAQHIEWLKVCKPLQPLAIGLLRYNKQVCTPLLAQQCVT
jgi:hypothetical protein